MKKHLLVLFAIGAQFVLARYTASAHPGSGIVVDPLGQVFFQDSAARTIWKIDTQGKLTAYDDKIGGHWMALDANGSFSRSDLTLVERITPAGVAPALIVADGGAPITINADGNLYYGLSISDEKKITVGMMRIYPDGTQETFAPDFAKVIKKLGITGLASGPDGTLYVACLTGIMKVKIDGTFTALANPIVVSDCDRDVPTPFLRGLDVDSGGMVYVAATGCRCVLKISPGGEVETILEAESPWSPTGVAEHDGDIFVLEYTNPNGGLGDGWLPRVRKRDREGRVTTLATISEEQQKSQPNRQILQPNR